MSFDGNLEHLEGYNPVVIIRDKGDVVKTVQLQVDALGVPILPNKGDYVQIDGETYLVTERTWNFDTGEIKIEVL